MMLNLSLWRYFTFVFDHPKYMMIPALNSPLQNSFNDSELGNVPVRGKMEEMIKGKIEYETPNIRKQRYMKFLKDVEEKGADASTTIGYSSQDIMATTSGQMTNMAINLDDNAIFASWIGHGLGLGVKDDINILFNDIRILMDIFNGWKYYRESLDSNPYLKGNQINAWNAQWLSHKYSRLYQEKNEMAGFSPYSSKDDIMIVDSITWTKLMFGISRQYKNIQMIGYLYNIGKINRTYGFVPFLLSEIRRPIELYKKLFGTIGDCDSMEELYGTALGFTEACKQGVIGVKALEPKGVKDYIYVKSSKNKVKMLKCKNDEKLEITYKTYQIWILAMLNNQELWDKSQEFAKVLHQYVNSVKKTTTKPQNQVEAVLNATNKNTFITALKEIVEVSKQKDEYVSMAKEINLMPTDNISYFLTLIRFNYASLNK